MVEHEPYMFWLLGASEAGYRSTSVSPIAHKLARAWSNMMRRCYDRHHKQYKQYGAKGVSVCKRWHQVANYVEDVQKLNGWAAKEADWEGLALDKDYYSSNQYSPSTCLWLTGAENNLYTVRAQPVKVTGLTGEATVYLSQHEAARATGVNQDTISLWLKGKYTQTTRLDLRFEYHITEHPLRRQLGGIIGTRRPYEEVTQASLGGSQC